MMARSLSIRQRHPGSVRVLLAAAICLALLGGAGLLPAPAVAATVTVTNGNDSGAGSLRQAITTAAAGDTIDFHSSVTTVTLTSGQLGISKNLTIQGSGIGGVTVQRNSTSGSFRIFEITDGATVKFNGLTIRNGRGSDTGGGVRNFNSTLTVEDSVIADNQVIAPGDFYGGGLANQATSANATMTVKNSIFQNNNGVVGSAIGNRATGKTANLTVTSSTFSGNLPGSGGGYAIVTYIDVGDGTLTVSESTISGNSVTGIMSYGTNGSPSIVNVTGTTISNNTGYGIFNYGAGGGSSTFTATNSTISGNSNTGAYNFSASGTGNLTLSHVTMMDNGGTTTGVHVGTDTASGTTNTAYNRSVFGHSNNSLTNYFGLGSGTGTKTRTSGGFNISQQDLPGKLGTDQEITNPQPDPAGLADNGGPTKTIALLATSPARNLIPNASCTQANDQRGKPRPQPVAGNCDSGAVEAQSTTLVLAPDPASAIYSGTADVTATLAETTSGAALSGKSIEFFLNGVSQGTATTNASGVASKSIALGATAAGTHTAPAQGLDATFAADSLHLGSTDDATLQVSKASTTTSGVADQSVPQGTASINVSATVQSNNGANLDGGTVTFDVKLFSTILATSGPLSVPTGASSQIVSSTIALSPSSSFPPGTYTIEATYSGATNIAGGTATGVLVIQEPTTLTVAPNPATSTFGGSMAVTATLKAGSSPMPGRTIEFFLNGVSQGTATTVSGGVASITIDLGTTAVGTYTAPGQGIRATFAGEINRAASVDTATLEVTKVASSTAPQAITVAYTSPSVTLTATVTNTSGGSPEANPVTFKIKQGSTTLATGSGLLDTGTGRATATLNLTPLAYFPIGHYTIEATYAASDNVEGSTGTATLTIVKADTRFATVTLETTYGNTTGTLRARLVRSNGDNGPVAGVPVVFRVNGAVVCGGAGQPACPMTGADGWATLANMAVSAGLNAGSHANVVRASFAGNANHNAADQSGALVVARRVLWVKPQNREVGFRQPNPPTTPPAGCLAQATATTACWLELANGSSFLPGDDWSDLNLSQLRFSYNRNPPATNASEYAGKTYRITALGIISTNYDIRYQEGTLTVVAP